jgi:hypothetical protein
MSLTRIKGSIFLPVDVITYAGYLYVTKHNSGIMKLDLSGNVINETWWAYSSTTNYSKLTVVGNYMYVAWGDNKREIAQIKMDSSGNFISVNLGFYVTPTGEILNMYPIGNNLCVRINSIFYLITTDDNGIFIDRTLIVDPFVLVRASTIYNSNIYVVTPEDMRKFDLSGKYLSKLL